MLNKNKFLFTCKMESYAINSGLIKSILSISSNTNSFTMQVDPMRSILVIVGLKISIFKNLLLTKLKEEAERH